MLVKNVPKAMSPWLGEVLPPVWGTLTSSAAKYVSEVVNLGDGDDDNAAEEVVDSDGEVIGFENLVNFSAHHLHFTQDQPAFALAKNTWEHQKGYFVPAASSAISRPTCKILGKFDT